MVRERAAVAALVRFHLASSVRVILGLAALQLMLLVVVVGMSPRPSVTLGQLVGALVNPAPGAPLPIVLALAGALAGRAAAPRVMAGAGGWITHLPTDRTTQRRAFLVALIVASLPLWILWALLWLGGGIAGMGAPLIRLLALPLVALAAGYVALPLARRLAIAPLAVVALIAAAWGSWLGLAASAMLLVLVERWAGPLVGRHKPIRRPRRPAAAVLLPQVIALRAVGWTTVLQAYALAVLPLGAAYLFLTNNTVEAASAGVAVRLGGGLALVILWVQVAEQLIKTRPPWGWARSLTWRARRRVADDALFLALLALPLLTTTVWLAFYGGTPIAAFAVFALVPNVTFRLVGAMRRRREALTGLGAAAIWEAFIVAAWLAVQGGVAWLLLALAPVALSRAAKREQRVKPDVWRERHELVVGDAVSWGEAR